VFVLAPNDITSRAIADVLAADQDVKSFVITGQDAEQDSVQSILDGRQSMTVFKDVRTLVQTAIDATLALLKGEPPATGVTYNNGARDVPPADPSDLDRQENARLFDRLWVLLPGLNAASTSASPRSLSIVLPRRAPRSRIRSTSRGVQ
jgi:ABC-type xylose transport system substrate-binding protein